MVPFGDDVNVAGSSRGSSQNTAANATESRIALMARHLIVVIPSSPSCASAQNGIGRPLQGLQDRLIPVLARGRPARTKLPQDGPGANRCCSRRMDGAILHDWTMS